MSEGMLFGLVAVGSVLAGLWMLGMWHVLHILAERKWWNRGTCAASGRPWKLIQMASNGARVYSDGAFESIHISYRMVDKFGNKKVTM